MQSKIVLITGANSGIGKATATDLAKRGATIIMVCRSQAKGEAARQEIIRESKNENIHLELCDLSSHTSIKKCAETLRSKYKSVDILINNAGAIFGHHALTEDGFEQTFGLNHLGYFLFTHYVLDLVKAGQDKRIINVSSLAHKFILGSIPWGDLQLKNIKYKQLYSYSLSKLYNIYFTKILAKKMTEEKTGITVNCLHPGTVFTGFGESGTKFFARLVKVGGPLLAKPKNGAKTSIYLATSPEVANITGEYFAHGKLAHHTKLSKNMDNAQKLWDKTLELTGIETFGNFEF